MKNKTGIKIEPGMRVFDSSTDDDDAGECLAFDDKNVVYRMDDGEIRTVEWNLVGICAKKPVTDDDDPLTIAMSLLDGPDLGEQLAACADDPVVCKLLDEVRKDFGELPLRFVLRGALKEWTRQGSNEARQYGLCVAIGAERLIDD